MISEMADRVEPKAEIQIAHARVKILMIQRNLTPASVAESIGMSRGYFYALVSGQTVNRQGRKRIEGFFQCSLWKDTPMLSFEQLLERVQHIADRAAVCQQSMQTLQSTGADPQYVQEMAARKLDQLYSELDVLCQQSGRDLFALLKSGPPNEGSFGLIKEPPQS